MIALSVTGWRTLDELRLASEARDDLTTTVSVLCSQPGTARRPLDAAVPPRFLAGAQPYRWLWFCLGVAAGDSNHRLVECDGTGGAPEEGIPIVEDAAVGRCFPVPLAVRCRRHPDDRLVQ